MKRSVQNLTHYNLFTADMGQLIPICCVPVLPGDTFRHNTSVMVRLSPMVAPVMHPLYVRVHHWFVPNRLLWENWEDFITGGRDGLGVNTPIFPTITFDSVTKGSIMDYFGINPTTNPVTVNALPFRAYALIYNEYYRDQDLVNELDVSLSDGEDEETQVGLLNCAWSKDYFTTARPTPQKGMDVVVPVTNSGEGEMASRYFTITAAFKSPAASLVNTGAFVAAVRPYLEQLKTQIPASWDTVRTIKLTPIPIPEITFNPGSGPVTITPEMSEASYATMFTVASPGFKDWSSNATSQIIYTSSTIQETGRIQVNDLRLAMALQRFEEEASRWGSRYVDYLRNLGVHSSDARLQRPEYLGGGRFQINTSEVLQTANGDDGTGVGNMYGHGLALGRSNRYIRFFEEHGYVITLFSVLPINVYGNGLKRDWLKRTMLDFWHPTIQNLGQQEVTRKEIWQDTVDPNTPFGFQDRFDEYRFEWSQIHGDFRDTLSDWHFARIFESEPVLNGTFVTANPTKRPFASQDTNILWCAAWNSIRARRLVSAVARPRIM